VYMSNMGKQGIQDVAKLNVQKAHYAANRLTASGKLSLSFRGSFFNEFAVKLPAGTNIKELGSKLLAHGIIGGYDLGRDYPEFAGHMLVAVTEQRTREDIDQFATVLEGLL
jgi:glycine dehydrogenase subunit 1